MTSTRPLLFIDTETGGLDPTRHALIEVAWATISDQEPRTLILPHDRAKIDPAAAEINGYYRRDLGDAAKWATDHEIATLRVALDGSTLVGANPSFDAGFLAHDWFPDRPWHYRLLDIGSMAYGVLRTPDMPGMKDVRDALTTAGRTIPYPDHTAAGDVRALVASYLVLRNWKAPRAG